MLIGPDMHNLLSPSAMFKDSDSRLRYVHLEPGSSALVLHGSARVPLRWDSRLSHLDYWSTMVAAVVNAPQLCAQVLAESAFGGKDERDRNISASMLMLHHAAEPHGLSHSGLEHRQHGHASTAVLASG